MVCAHTPCRCLVGADHGFCGAECKAAAQRPSLDEEDRDLACDCGHSDCYRDADSALGEAPE